MDVTIYADVIFLINFVMDYLILWIVSKLKKKKVKKRRLFLGAFTASLTYCLLIFLFNPFYNFFTSLLILGLSLFVTFGERDLKDIAKSFLYAHISAFAVGGLSIALFYYTNITDLIGNALGFTIEYFSVKILIVAICVSFIAIKAGIYFVNEILIKKQVFYDITIKLDQKDICITALMDTGNSLSDPITKYPVIITEFESIKALLPENLRLLFYEKKEEDYTLVIDAIEGTELMSSIRLISFKSIGKENGMLIGFKPEQVKIQKEDEIIILTDVIIGIYNLKLSEGKYHALLSPAVLETYVDEKIETENIQKNKVNF